MLCSILDTARALKLSERHCRRMISEKRWPFYRLGKRIIRLDLQEIKNLGRVVAKTEKEK